MEIDFFENPEDGVSISGFSGFSEMSRVFCGSMSGWSEFSGFGVLVGKRVSVKMRPMVPQSLDSLDSLKCYVFSSFASLDGLNSLKLVYCAADSKT